MIILVEDSMEKAKEVLADFGKHTIRKSDGLIRFHLPKEETKKGCSNDFMFVNKWTGESKDAPFFPKAKTIISLYCPVPADLLNKLEQTAKESLNPVKIFYHYNDFLQAKKKAANNQAA